MLVKCIATILDMQPPKNYKPHVRTNTGKQMISFKAVDLWSTPQNLKDLNVYTFPKNVNIFFLSEQYSK